MDPRQWVDLVSGNFKDLAKTLGVKMNRFIRTTDVDHIIAVQHLWSRLVASGDIYRGTHSGWYCVSDETFYAEHETLKVGSDEKTMRISKETGKPVQWVSENNYMFRLSKFRERIIEWVRSTELVVPSTRLNDLWDYLTTDTDNFTDISVSRRASAVKWGIPVPDDPEQVIYVWLDALTNYLTVGGYPQHSATPDIHVLGKDILKFHAVYWPAFLMAAGLPLPRKLIVHGHWTIGKEKMSKSLGNVVDPFDLVKKYGVDAVRYYLLRKSPLNSDSDFSKVDLVKVVNNELVNQLGNLMSRAFTTRFLEVTRSIICDGDPAFITQASKSAVECDKFMQQLDFPMALEKAQIILKSANSFFSDREPWTLLEAGEESHRKLAKILVSIAYGCLEYAKTVSPIVPDLAAKIHDIFGYDRPIDLARIRPVGSLIPRLQIT